MKIVKFINTAFLAAVVFGLSGCGSETAVTEEYSFDRRSFAQAIRNCTSFSF